MATQNKKRPTVEIIHRHLGLQKVSDMTIGYGIMASLAFSAAFLMAIATMPGARAQMSTSGAEVVTNGPQINPGAAERARQRAL